MTLGSSARPIAKSPLFPFLWTESSDAVVAVHVPADVPEDHIENEEYGEDEERDEDGLCHRRDDRLHVRSRAGQKRRAEGLRPSVLSPLSPSLSSAPLLRSGGNCWGRSPELCRARTYTFRPRRTCTRTPRREGYPIWAAGDPGAQRVEGLPRIEERRGSEWAVSPQVLSVSACRTAEDTAAGKQAGSRLDNAMKSSRWMFRFKSRRDVSRLKSGEKSQIARRAAALVSKQVD